MSTSEESVALSEALKKLGWKFVGPTTVYAFMQAMRLVNDRVEGCLMRDVVERATQAVCPARSLAHPSSFRHTAVVQTHPACLGAATICSTKYRLRFIANLPFALEKLLRNTNTCFCPGFLQRIIAASRLFRLHRLIHTTKLTHAAHARR